MAAGCHYQKFCPNLAGTVSSVMILSYHDRIMALENGSTNQVRMKRLDLGLTQAELAERAGISRSAIAAIEGNQLVTSVSTALALSAALGSTVEELFSDQSQNHLPDQWAWQPANIGGGYWRAEVGGRTLRYPASFTPMLAYLPDSVTDDYAKANARHAAETLVLASCDPAASLLASQFAEVTGLRLIVLQRSSRDAISMLREGLVHLAGLHLATPEQPLKNQEFIREQLGSGFHSIRLSQWQEGIVTRSTAKLGSIRAARTAKLQWVGREPGSGARQCLDQVLDRRSAPKRIARDHRGVVEAVRGGWADAGVCVRLVGEEAGLNFLPVQDEAFDVCYSASFAEDRRWKAFQNVVRSSAYRKLFGQLPGYDTSETGHVWTGS